MTTDGTNTCSLDETVRRQFESARRQGRSEPIEQFLPSEEQPQYLPTLEELVHIDLEFAWKAWQGSSDGAEAKVHRPPLVEAYLARFPRLNQPPVVLELLQQEYLVRHRYGDSPSSAEYCARFPKLITTGAEVQGSLPVTRGEAAAPARVPGYEILDVLGRGGMGVVYKARQTSLNRIVALKMILAGAHAGSAELARFRAEAEVVAHLEHPNVVHIHEIGEQGGLPYLSLEFVDGGSLAQKLNGAPQPARQAAERVETLARAMHRAHQSGIVHRDLKPANVLLTADDTPKITDFGLAKRLGEAAGQTKTGEIMGTPSYMAPEQAAGKTKEIGPAADIYALGAILYELLTGRPPFRAATAWDTVVQVLSEDPVPPMRLQPKVPRDLETICLKCLQKETGKRYGSAELLANDLHRFLLGEPIQARPVGLRERTLKWVKRHPARAALLGLSVVAAVSLLAMGGFWYEARLQAAEERERQQIKEAAYQEDRARTAEKHGQEMRHSWYTSDMTLGQQALQSGNIERVLELLERHRPKPGQTDLRGFEWYYLWKLCHSDLMTLHGHTNNIEAVAYSPDSKTLATASGDNTVKLWDVATGKARTLQGHKDAVLAVAFSPDDKTLATGGWDMTVKLWDTTTGRELATLTGHTMEVQSVAFSPDGAVLATGAGARDLQVKEPGECILWDVALRKKQATLPRRHIGVVAVAFHPTSELVATGSWDRTVKVWNTVTGQMVANFDWFGSQVMALAFSPDGQKLAIGLINGQVARAELDATTTPIKGRGLPNLTAHTVMVSSLAFSPDSKFLATASRDRTVKLWDATTGQAATTFWGHLDQVRSVTFAPDGKTLASAGNDRTVKIWIMPTESEPLIRKGMVNPNALALTPEGKQVATPTADNMVKVWDISSRRERAALTADQLGFTKSGAGQGGSLVFSSNGRWLAAGGSGGTIKVWDLVTRKEPASFQGVAKGGISALTFDADNKFLATAGPQGDVTLWDVATGQARGMCRGHKDLVLGMAFAPDGKLLATASVDHTVRVWDSATAQEVVTLRGHSSVVVRVAFSADGRLLATGSSDETVKLWDVADWTKAKATLKGHAGGVYALAFVPDGKRLAAGAGDGTVKLWDVTTAQELAVLKGHAAAVVTAAFSANGKTLVTGSKDTTIRQWRAASEEETTARSELATTGK